MPPASERHDPDELARCSSLSSFGGKGRGEEAVSLTRSLVGSDCDLI